jgi:hypothetical protein
MSQPFIGPSHPVLVKELNMVFEQYDRILGTLFFII